MECSTKQISGSEKTKEALFSLRVDKPDEEMRKQVKARWDRVAKPLDSLGEFEALTAKIGAIQRTAEIDIRKKAVIVMCADNGIVEEGVSQSGQEVTAAVAQKMVENKSSVGKMAVAAGAKVLPVDIGINRKEEITGLFQKKVAYGTRNFRKEPAMTEEEAVKAVFAGIEMAACCSSQGYGILATGEMGIGNTTTSSAVAAALTGLPVSAVTGRGAGLCSEGLAKKCLVIEEAIERYELKGAEPLKILTSVGGLDIAGLAGVFIGGALYHLPVVIDGVISAVSALLAERLLPGVKDYMIPSHSSREPAAAKLMEELGLHPVIDAGLALGEGTGAVMMFSLLDLALALYEEQTTFDDMGIEQYTRKA